MCTCATYMYVDARRQPVLWKLSFYHVGTGNLTPLSAETSLWPWILDRVQWSTSVYFQVQKWLNGLKWGRGRECMHVCECIYLCRHMWRPEIDNGTLINSSLLGDKVSRYWLDRCRYESQDLSITNSSSIGWGCRLMLPRLACCVGAGDLNPGPCTVILHPLSHLPSWWI